LAARNKKEALALIPSVAKVAILSLFLNLGGLLNATV
jgi:hypothetical protein